MATREIHNTFDCKEQLLLIEIKNNNYGGYRHDLLENELDETEIEFCVCSTCNGVMRNACLVNEPDQILVCEVCLIKGKDSITMVKVRKNISELRVKCSLMERGCVWKGSLGEIDAHLDECAEFILMCYNLCGVLLKRSEVQNHCENECQLRIVKCQYCGVTVKNKDLENHYETCLECPLPCPNECLKSILRKELKSHIDEECPNTLVTCPYKEMGCEVLSKRSELQKHEKAFKSEHFDKIKIFFPNQVVKLELEIEDQRDEIKQLTTKVKNIEEQYEQLEDINLYLKVSSESNEDSADAWEEDQSPLREKVCEIQDRKTSLEIRYQLFTNQRPGSKRVGPFNSDRVQYCDLVNIICNQERNELGEDMTVELYTCEGYPLATRPISYISKLSDWCLKEYPDTPLLYAVPRLKCYTDKCTQYMTAAPLCKGKDSIYIRNEDCGFRGDIQTNCKQATYFQLRKTIQDMTGIPGHLIQLFNYCEVVHSNEDSITLDELNIANHSVLNMKLDSHFWDLGKHKNFSLQECKPTWLQEQSTLGTSFFFSCLYSLADWMSEPDQMASDTFFKTLGHIRSITGCPPLIHALNIMFRNETLTLPHRVAIQECLVLLFKTIIPKNKKLHSSGNEIINEKKVTEVSNCFWIHFIHYSNKSHLQTEQYSTHDLLCSKTFKRMTDPVSVRDVEGVEHIVDSHTLRKNEKSEILYYYKRMISSFIGDKAIIWNCITAPTCGIDLKEMWENMIELCTRFPALCIQIPENINVTCPRPSMIPLENGNIGVYIGKSRNILKPFTYYDFIIGESNNFEVQELDLAVKMNPPPLPYPSQKMFRLFDNKKFQTITHEPEEIIMVILETSKLMESNYFGDKTKFDLVLESFLAFCNRSGSYYLNHIIGLVLFAQNCTLQYPFSKDFRRFINKFNHFPIRNGTAIYDAIKFAVEQLNNFTAAYPGCKKLQRRILCLTSGEDTHSKITPQEATRLLIENGIKMDCVLLCENMVHTHAIAKASGGYSFRPANLQEMLSIFEQETLLSMNCRQYSKASFFPGECIDLVSQFFRDFDTEPSQILPERSFINVQPIDRCLSRALSQKLPTRLNTNLSKRILQELSYCQTNHHPDIEVFPGEDDVDIWIIIMKGPKDTAYDGGIFELFIEFTDEYPAKPPIIQFMTPIYNCNINSCGRISHPILDRFYTPDLRIGDILDQVYGLLTDVESNDPLDSVKAEMLSLDREEYFREARIHTLSHSKVPKLPLCTDPF